MSDPVSLSHVEQALSVVRAVLPPTPLIEWPGLSRRLGGRFYLKHENHQPVGAFKVRGGVHLVGRLAESLKTDGVLGVSTGNHGQSLAFAARHFQLPCQIVVPLENNPDKVSAIEGLGASVHQHGKDFDEAREFAETLVNQSSARYVHSANEPLLISGVGTMAWEILDQLPKPDFVLVPIGLGSGVCGTCIVTKNRSPQTKVIGVQATGAPAVAQSWKSRDYVESSCVDTWAEGLATRVPAEMTMEIMWRFLDDIILVDDDELRQATYLILKHTHNLAEGAGAAALAAALKFPDRFQNRETVGILSGGNLNLEELPSIMAAGKRCG